MLSRNEFIEWVSNNEDPDPSSDTWLVSAASVIITVATNGEFLDKEDIVDAAQKLAARMPADVVAAGALNMIDTRRKIVEEISKQN